MARSLVHQAVGVGRFGNPGEIGNPLLGVAIPLHEEKNSSARGKIPLLLE
jgi:hypothetical protein